jgi:hypothetical protein
MAKKIKLELIPSINIEDVPKEFQDKVWEQLPTNGGNVLSIEADSDFGKFLQQHGFEFNRHDKSWGWLVVFR